MPREILVDWTTPSGSGKRSVFMFNTTSTAAAQRFSLSLFLGAIDAALSNQVTWTIETSGRVMDFATGTLTSLWTADVPYSGTGGTAGEPVADATQALVRWNTGEVVNGRILKGRTFIPGLAVGNLDDGNLGSALQALWQGYAQQLIDDEVGLSVWHRPVASSGGLLFNAAAASVWEELAVLRRRRG